MHHDLGDCHRCVIRPMLPNKPRSVPGVNDLGVLNGIFWVSCARISWRDLPESYGPHTTCYNRFVRWPAGRRLESDHGGADGRSGCSHAGEIETSIMRCTSVGPASRGIGSRTPAVREAD